MLKKICDTIVFFTVLVIQPICSPAVLWQEGLLVYTGGFVMTRIANTVSTTTNTDYFSRRHEDDAGEKPTETF